MANAQAIRNIQNVKETPPQHYKNCERTSACTCKNLIVYVVSQAGSKGVWTPRKVTAGWPFNPLTLFSKNSVMAQQFFLEGTSI